VSKISIIPRHAAIVLLLATTPTLAQAYIDPGSGAYMVQALFALVGAVLFYVRHPIRSLRTFARWFAKRWSSDAVSATDNTALESEHEHVPLDMEKAKSSSDRPHF